MKKILVNRKTLIHGGGDNCRNIYESCLASAMVIGAGVMLSVPAAGWLLGPLTGAVMMEQCRQEYVGCYNP